MVPVIMCVSCQLCTLLIFITRPVMIGNSVREWRHSQNGQLVSIGKGAMTKPNAPMAFAPRAQDPVRFGRVFHMQDHLVFGLVSSSGNDW